jgi:hypothetical protein
MAAESQSNSLETVPTTRGSPQNGIDILTTSAATGNSCGGSWEDLSLSKQQAMQLPTSSSPSSEQQEVHFHLHVHIHSPSPSSAASSASYSPALLPSTSELTSVPMVDAVPSTVTTTTTSFVLPMDCSASSSCSTSSLTAGLLTSIRLDLQEYKLQQEQQEQSRQQQLAQSQLFPPLPPSLTCTGSTMKKSSSTSSLPQSSAKVVRRSRSPSVEDENADTNNHKEPWVSPFRNQVLRLRDRGGGERRHCSSNSPPHRRKRTRNDSVLDSVNSNNNNNNGSSNRQLPQPRNMNRRRWLIPAEHPIKLLWDFLTIVLSIANAYATHTAIRDRKFDSSPLVCFCELWFVFDFLLNFVTERQIGDVLLTDFKSVWARYLTTWFVVDLLSLVPGEMLYVKPIIDRNNRRGWLKRSFFRTKAVVGVTRVLRVGHVRLFGKVARHTKRAGMGANRLLRVIIKYVPRYLLFLRNMKGVVAVRVLRQVHWLRKVWLNLRRRIYPPAAVEHDAAQHDKSDDDTYSLTEGYDDDDYSFEDEYDDYQDDDDDDMDAENSSTDGQNGHCAHHRDEHNRENAQISHENHWEFVDDGGEPY